MRPGRPAGELAAALGMSFRDPTLLRIALRHPSFRKEEADADRAGTPLDDNARLEFLGDAVLDLILSEWLFARAPSEREGGLTARRSSYVDEEAVGQVAIAIDIDEYLSIGNSEVASKDQKAISKRGGDALEALIGATYLDGGYAAAVAVVRMLWARRFPELTSPPRSAKSA